MTFGKMKMALTTFTLALAQTACGGTTTCTSLNASLAPMVTVNAVAADAPTATGGTIVDGTYYVTAGTDYVGAAGTAGTVGVTQEVFQVTGTSFASALLTTSKNESASGQLAVDGINLTLNGTCPSTGSATATYTASATTFTTYEVAANGTFATMYTKQ